MTNKKFLIILVLMKIGVFCAFAQGPSVGKYSLVSLIKTGEEFSISALHDEGAENKYLYIPKELGVTKDWLSLAKGTQWKCALRLIDQLHLQRVAVTEFGLCLDEKGGTVLYSSRLSVDEVQELREAIVTSP